MTAGPPADAPCRRPPRPAPRPSGPESSNDRQDVPTDRRPPCAACCLLPAWMACREKKTVLDSVSVGHRTRWSPLPALFLPLRPIPAVSLNRPHEMPNQCARRQALAGGPGRRQGAGGHSQEQEQGQEGRPFPVLDTHRRYTAWLLASCHTLHSFVGSNCTCRRGPLHFTLFVATAVSNHTGPEVVRDN